MLELRLRSRIEPAALDGKIGKVLGPADFSALVTGAATLRKPNGDLLAIYLPGAVPLALRELAYPVLTTIRSKTYNRGLASGSRRVNPSKPGSDTASGGTSKRTYSRGVQSSIIGAFESVPPFFRCRLTEWTGQHADQFRSIAPYIGHIGGLFRDHVYDRWLAQMSYIARTQPEWVIPDTPYSTITVNNTYATGVHKDVGDLPEGFSCLSVLRRGLYTGAVFTFPEYRIGFDLQDGDVLLMDAHEWHGNTAIMPASPDAERISVVLYYRTNMAKCGTPEEEYERAKGRAPL